MFYIGSHWGSISDGYVCSSVRMKRAFKHRPNTFKRRIIAVRDTRDELLLEEQRWLLMIPDEHLGTKYYNLHRHTAHWSGRPDMAIVREKLKAAWTEERRQRASVAQSATWTEERKAKFKALTTGRQRGEAAKERMRNAWTPERREKNAARLREITKKRFENYWDTHLTREGKLALERERIGYVPPDRSEIAKVQWSQKTTAQKDEFRAKMSAAAKGKICIVDPNGTIKRVPSEELDIWIGRGWVRGRTITPSTESLRKRKF